MTDIVTVLPADELAAKKATLMILDEMFIRLAVCMGVFLKAATESKDSTVSPEGVIDAVKALSDAHTLFLAATPMAEIDGPSEETKEHPLFNVNIVGNA